MTWRDMTVSDVDRLDEARDETRAFHMDEAVFRAFYDRTARGVWAYLYRLTRDSARADDLLQDTYYRFLRLDTAPEDEAHRRNYLYRIATNLVRDELRRTRGVQVALPEEDAGRDVLRAPERMAEDAVTRSDVGRAMTRLSARERELLWLAYAEGATHREIAEMLGLKAGSIKLLLFRARRRFADILRRPAVARPDREGA
jgi:RNA polymerase sigma-70 factor (ECF subfamily)